MFNAHNLSPLFRFYLFQFLYIIKTPFEYNYQPFFLKFFLLLDTLKLNYCDYNFKSRYNHLMFEFGIELSDILYLDIRNPEDIIIRTVRSNIRLVSRRIIRRHLIYLYSITKTIIIKGIEIEWPEEKIFRSFPLR